MLLSMQLKGTDFVPLLFLYILHSKDYYTSLQLLVQEQLVVRALGHTLLMQQMRKPLTVYHHLSRRMDLLPTKGRLLDRSWMLRLDNQKTERLTLLQLLPNCWVQKRYRVLR
jgi:hypothetical protein